MSSIRFYCFLALLLASTMTLAGPISWQQTSLKGRVLLGKMLITTSWSCVSPATTAEGLFSLSEDALAPQGQILRVVTETVVWGKKRTNILWLDQSQGYAVLQRERLRLKDGKRNHKIERYAPKRMVRMERTPATRKERKIPYPEWTKEQVETFDFAETTTEAVMTEPYALFFLLAQAPIQEPGDTYTYRIYAGNRVLLMELIATEWADTKTGRWLIVTAEAVAPEADAEAGQRRQKQYEWFGMKGQIRLDFDPESRTIQALAGRTRAGKIKLKMVGSTAATPTDCLNL